jgi:octaprenyl-diphosphate synthase
VHQIDGMFYIALSLIAFRNCAVPEHAINLMNTTGAIEATRTDALDWSNKAQQSLSLLPDSELKTILQALAIYVVSRVS